MRNHPAQTHAVAQPTRLWHHLSPLHRLGLLAIISIASAAAIFAEEPPAALSVGDTLPTPTLAGDNQQLSTLTNNQATVIAVFRGGWCPYCTKHLQELEALQGELKEQGYAVLAIAPDSAENLAAAAQEFAISFPLLADTDFAFSNALGLTFALDAKTVKKYQGYKIPLRNEPTLAAPALPEPALIITDKKGTITYLHRNADFKQRMAPEDIRKIIAELAK